LALHEMQSKAPHRYRIMLDAPITLPLLVNEKLALGVRNSRRTLSSQQSRKSGSEICLSLTLHMEPVQKVSNLRSASAIV
jgi:hypothetical protein